MPCLCSTVFHQSRYIPVRRKRSNARDSGSVGRRQSFPGTIDRWMLVQMTLDVATCREQTRLVFTSTGEKARRWNHKCPRKGGSTNDKRTVCDLGASLQVFRQL